MIMENNLIGKRFGRLIVVSKADDYISKKGSKRRRWRCKCDCGNEKDILEYNLLKGNTKSCGCLWKEKSQNGELRNTNKTINNKIREEDNIVFIKLSNSEKEMICNKDDWEKIRNSRWVLNHKGYARCAITKNGKKKTFFAHRMIIDAKKGEIVDHINRNRLDNRKENLRIVDARASATNRKLKDGNKSGYSGVYKKKKYCTAMITINGKWSLIGRYNTFEEAVLARRKAEKEIYGITSQ